MQPALIQPDDTKPYACRGAGTDDLGAAIERLSPEVGVLGDIGVE